MTQTIERARDVVKGLADSDGRERRWANVDRAEVRQVNEDGSFDFEGHAAVFDGLSEDMGFREVIKRGAFKGVLDNDVRLLFNHDPNLLLARTTSNTLELSEDPEGLLVKANLAPTSYAQDIRVLLDRRDISAMSFSFAGVDDEWSMTEDGEALRTVYKFKAIDDVSIVAFPAYPQTDAAARAFRKLDRGEHITVQEQKAITPLFRPYSAEPGDEERVLQAAGAEPQDGPHPDSQADAESPQTQDGLSGRSARLRVRELTARL